MAIEFNDKLGSRSLRHLNVIIASDSDDNSVVFPFEGKSIPGIIQVIREDYTKNGKWSHTTWTVEPANGVYCATVSQDWETSKWLNSMVWESAVAEFKEKLSFVGGNALNTIMIEDDAIVRFIRATWPKYATCFDAKVATDTNNTNDAVKELIAAQKELAELQREISMMEAAQQAKENDMRVLAEAEATRLRVANAREAMKKGASLADLKALLG